MNKNLFFLCFFFSLLHGMAQQDPRYTLFNSNYAIINPAAAGSKEKLSLVMLHRQQWTGYSNGAPYTSTFSLDMPVFKLRSAIGMVLTNDRHGIVRNSFAGFNYALIAHTSDYGRLSLGLQIGVNQNKAHYDDIRTDPGNRLIENDPTFNYGHNATSYAPSAGWGIYYYDRFFKFGLSMPVLTPYTYYSGSSGGSKVNHFFITSGVNLILNDHVSYNPRVLLKVVPGAPLQAELYNQFIFSKKLAGGVSFRTGESVSGIISYTLHPQFNVSYCYDLVVLNKLRSVQYGSHEIGINYVFRFPKYSEQQKVLRIKRKHKCIDFDNPKKKRFFKEVEDIFYDRN